MSEFKTVQELKQLDPLKAEPFRSILVLRRKAVKTTKNGSPFLSMEMGDAGGSFTANALLWYEHPSSQSGSARQPRAIPTAARAFPRVHSYSYEYVPRRYAYWVLVRV